MKIVGNRIKEYRKKENITQMDLAAYCNVYRETIACIESNKYAPSLILAMDIAERLHADVKDIFIFETDNRIDNPPKISTHRPRFD